MGGILCDHEIRRRVAMAGGPAAVGITPFADAQVKRIDPDGRPVKSLAGALQTNWRRVVGYGLSGYGYDIRLGTAFRFLKPAGWVFEASVPGGSVFAPANVPVLDPLDGAVGDACFDPPASEPARVLTDPFLLRPGECVLGESVERIRMPLDCQALVICKSTWARCFLDLNTTPLEPGWEGTVTLEIVNHASLPLRVRPGEGIAQVVFIQGEGFPETPYNEQPASSYMNQSGPTPPRHSAA